MARLSDVATINPKSDRVLGEQFVSFVGMAQLDDVTAIASPLDSRSFAAVSKGYTVFRNCDLLVAKITPCFENGKIGRAVLDEEIGVGSTEFHVVRPGHEIDERYLLHFLRRPEVRKSGELRMTGSGGQRRVPADFLQKLEVPLPPLEEQRRIAAILDRTDALRAKRRQVLAHFESLETALYEDVFSSGEWPSFRLGEVASTTSGGTPNRARPENYGGGIAWVKSGELHSGVVMETSETISDIGLTSSSASLMPAGTVLIAMYGATAGVVSRLGIDAATNQAVCSITPGPQLDASYLIAALKSMSSQLRNLRSGGAQPNLSQAVIRALEIKVPSIRAQQEFARKISGVASARQRIKLGMATDDQLFTSIQSRAFRGDL
ncbi:restriction endonuclease subunit S [Rathayibacter sp. AY1C1]|uniref:restriction endonuclease subunit S n=1 Tax=Rathayibacter sp. AY1C1 TaxID=2080534 RepID=UPI0021577656|nr:restriction endonuclease subunit S [Rathayibacter sp. AY1C1]